MTVRTSYRRGQRAETLAVWWLRLKGYRILVRRHVTGRGSGAGEIDIIARRGKVLAFVEVKARPDEERALSAITLAQRKRLWRAAEGFLARHPELAHLHSRFDALYILPGRWPRHLADAWRES